MTDYARASRVIAGGSLTRSKAPGRFYPIGAGPHYADRGHGAYLIDAEGHELIDMLCALGAISLGYGRTPYNAARAIHDGWIYSLPSVLEAHAAEAVLAHVAPWATRVKFVKTGSEATHAAYRIAKRANGRPLVLIFEGSYHGWHEWSWRGPDGVPESSSTVVAPYGVDLSAWLESQRINASDLAAIFVEPHRWQPTLTGWLEHVKAFCGLTGAVFVLDEMIYGGRWALGGASEYFGVTPDLACYGKALGNGAPIACVVGGDDLLEAHGEMVSGTYSGDTVALAALMDVIEYYQDHPVIETLWERGTQLADGLRQVCAAFPNLGARVEGAAPVHLRLAFPDPAMGKRFSAEMVLRDILWHPDCTNIGASHHRTIIEQVVQVAHDSMAALAREGG